MTTPGDIEGPWHVTTVSRIGASHRRARLENQDAVGSLRTRVGVGAFVADGHGSHRSFRSAQGSASAVDISKIFCEQLFSSHGIAEAWKWLPTDLDARVGSHLVQDWQKAVLQEVKGDAEHGVSAKPFMDDELGRLAELEGPAAVEQVREKPFLAYGSTVLAAVATDSFLACWQVGDGDIVVVDAGGRATRPIPPDPTLLGNATTSLCSPRAWKSFRWSFSAHPGEPAPLVLVSTDGLANSYSTDEGFLRFGKDILDRIVADDIEAVEAKLGSWLSRISGQGSGDDVSLGLICHLPTINALRDRGDTT